MHRDCPTCLFFTGLCVPPHLLGSSEYTLQSFRHMTLDPRTTHWNLRPWSWPGLLSQTSLPRKEALVFPGNPGPSTFTLKLCLHSLTATTTDHLLREEITPSHSIPATAQVSPALLDKVAPNTHHLLVLPLSMQMTLQNYLSSFLTVCSYLTAKSSWKQGPCLSFHVCISSIWKSAWSE